MRRRCQALIASRCSHTSYWQLLLLVIELFGTFSWLGVTFWNLHFWGSGKTCILWVCILGDRTHVTYRSHLVHSNEIQEMNIYVYVCAHKRMRCVHARVHKKLHFLYQSLLPVLSHLISNEFSWQSSCFKARITGMSQQRYPEGSVELSRWRSVTSKT